MRLKYMNIIKSHRLLEMVIMSQATLGNCSSTTAPALSYYRPSMDICIALLPAIHGSICSFWKNLSGQFIRLACNHSLCTGSTVVGQCMEQLPNGYAFRRIEQIDSLTDFIKHAPYCLHSYEMSGPGKYSA